MKDRRGMRVREFYGYALIAGIPTDKARRMYPGFIMDMFKLRAEYDVKVNGGKIVRKKTLGG